MGTIYTEMHFIIQWNMPDVRIMFAIVISGIPKISHDFYISNEIPAWGWDYNKIVNSGNFKKFQDFYTTVQYSWGHDNDRKTVIPGFLKISQDILVYQDVQRNPEKSLFQYHPDNSWGQEPGLSWDFLGFLTKNSWEVLRKSCDILVYFRKGVCLG